MQNEAYCQFTVTYKRSTAEGHISMAVSHTTANFQNRRAVYSSLSTPISLRFAHYSHV